jgi:hypothetical protein
MRVQGSQSACGISLSGLTATGVLPGLSPGLGLDVVSATALFFGWEDQLYRAARADQ